MKIPLDTFIVYLSLCTMLTVEKSVATSLRAAPTWSNEQTAMLAVLPDGQVPARGMFWYEGMTKGGGRLEQ